MTASVAIGLISQALALCGVVSIRMFLPVFLYFLTMKLLLVRPNIPLVPDFVRQMAEHTPEWQTSSIFLTVFGILAALELAAMRNPDIKEFLVEDLDRYAKPVVSFLLILRLVTTAQMLGIEELVGGSSAVQTASFGGFVPVVLAVIGGYATWFCCRVRTVALGVIQSIDPDDDLRLQSLCNYLGEIMLLTVFVVLVVLPPLALILTVAGMLAAMCFQRLWIRYEQRHSHPCAACAAAGRETSVSDCALICPVCGTEQPDVRQVGWFGLSGSSPLADLPPDEHAFRLLAAHRCRWCASPLDRSHVCPRCSREQWTDELQEFYVRRTDIRSGLLMSLTIIPFVGTMLALILFRPFAVRPLAVHLSAGGRFMTSLMMTFLKLLLLVPLILLSAVPLLGLLVLLPRYLSVRAKFLRALARV